MDKLMNTEAGEYAIRGGPGVAMSGLYLFGVPIGDVAMALAAFYTVLQIGFFLYKRYENYKAKKNGS